MENQSEILLYQTEDGQTRIQVQLDADTVWLTQEQMAELFQRDRSVITKHIRNVFQEGELAEESNVQILHFAHSDKPVKAYSLDVVISVGYRVKSQRGVQFRIWATQRLKEYLIKGFTLDDQRLKNDSGTDRYFDELLERIRDIRTSERKFYKKVADIYATSIDYDPTAEVTRTFYATVQNKFHFAVTGQTAAEIINSRANADQPNMGLTNWPGDRILSQDVTIAKNYLSADELSQLNLLVDQYLSFAELQAQRKKPMTMRDWIEKLHGFLQLNERDILQGAGRVSKQLADEKAAQEYHKFAEKRRLEILSNSDFDRLLESANPPNKLNQSGRKKDEDSV